MVKYDLKEVATVSSKAGLYKVLKPTRNGVIIEALDKEKKRMMIQTRHKISLLNEISIFTTDGDGSVLLENVFELMHSKHENKLPVTAESSDKDLSSFMKTILPNYDDEKVYHSDMRKLIHWYDVVNTFVPPVVEEKAEKKKPKAKAKPAAKGEKTTSKKKPVAKSGKK